MRMIATPYYTLYTDLPPDGAQEAVLRITRMAEEYHERTKGFSGQVNQRLPFYLFNDREDYLNAGAMPGTAGVFVRRSGPNAARWLMALADPTRESFTWHAVQHEGFHQFADATIGPLPTWANEGLAEYFGESIWTGDGFVTGIIPPERLKIVRDRLSAKKFITLKDMMLMSHEEWNGAMSVSHYHQAWSMTHFLAHGENGKYQGAFGQFIGAMAKKQPWEKAWEQSFGSAALFEQRWSDWWLKQPEDPTAELYTRATLSTLTSFIARGYAQKQPVDNLETFIRQAQHGALKFERENWLPSGLLDQAVARMSRDRTTYTVERASAPNQPPRVVATLPNGTQLIASFPAKHSIPVKVSVEVRSGPTLVSGKSPMKPIPMDLPRKPAAKSPPAEGSTGTAGVGVPGPSGATGTPTASRPPATPPVLIAPPGASSEGPVAGLPPAGEKTGRPGLEPMDPPRRQVPGDGPVQSLAEGKGPVRETIKKFIVENNAFGKEDHPLVTDLMNGLDKALDADKSVCFRLGPDLTKSHLATQITVHADQVFITEFTPSQAERATPRKGVMTKWDLNATGHRAGQTPVSVGLPGFSHQGPADPNQPLKGNIILRGMNLVDDPSVVLRMVVRGPGTNHSYVRPITSREPSILHTFGYAALGEQYKGSGALVILFEVCRTKNDVGEKETYEVLSNTVAVVVDFEAPAEK